MKATPFEQAVKGTGWSAQDAQAAMRDFEDAALDKRAAKEMKEEMAEEDLRPKGDGWTAEDAEAAARAFEQQAIASEQQALDQGAIAENLEALALDQRATWQSMTNPEVTPTQQARRFVPLPKNAGKRPPPAPAFNAAKRKPPPPPFPRAASAASAPSGVNQVALAKRVSLQPPPPTFPGDERFRT